MKRLIFAVVITASIGLMAAPPRHGGQKAPQKGTQMQQVRREAKPVQQARREAKPVQQARREVKPVQQARREAKPVQQARREVKPVPQVRREVKPVQRVRPAPKNIRVGKAPKKLQQSHHKFGARGAGGFIKPPHHNGFHANRPRGARFWSRPELPPFLAGALYAWSWIEAPWNYIVDGVYYYGEGYYFDGYNYCYNGGYHLTPPPMIVAQPVVTQPVVTQPVVTQPVVVAPVAPPPPRRRGLLGLLFGD